MLAPAGLSQTLAESLSRAVGEILREPSSREMLANLGLEPVGSSPAQFAGAMQREREYWGPVIKASGIRRD